MTSTSDAAPVGGPAAPFECLRVARQAAVLTITLARPARLNALTAATHAELRRALADAAADETVRVVVLTGEGRAFSSGQDLGDDLPRDAGGRVDLGPPIERDYNPLVMALAEYPKVTVAALNGPAVGASANIALACDLVVACRSATIHQAFARIGLMPDAGGTWFLPRLVGPKRALALTLLAEPVGADEALAMGLVAQVFPDESFADEVAALAARLAAGPALAYRLTKQALAASATNGLAEQLALERDLQRQAGRSEDFTEGLAAFRERRPPVFRGR